MEKKRAIWLGVVLLVIAGGLSWQIWRNREPMYDGRSLSYWLGCYSLENRTETSVQQADHALQAIGTNAVPTLLHMLQKEDSPLKLRLKALLDKQHFITIGWKLARIQNWEAMIGFALLRGDGKAAVPDLIKMYQGNPSRWSKSCVISSLGSIGPAASNAVPILASSLGKTGDPSRIQVINALGTIHSNPESAVPPLIDCLSDPDPNICESSALALAGFKGDARTAVPALTKLLSNSNPQIRSAALDALKKIDPESKAKFGDEYKAHQNGQ